jgi:hypothetical protein
MRTIQDLIDGDYDLAVYCEARNCTHGRRVDLKELAAKLGPNHGAMHDDLAGKFRCEKCGGKKTSIRITPYASRAQLPEGAWSGRKP